MLTKFAIMPKIICRTVQDPQVLASPCQAAEPKNSSARAMLRTTLMAHHWNNHTTSTILQVHKRKVQIVVPIELGRLPIKCFEVNLFECYQCLILFDIACKFFATHLLRAVGVMVKTCS